MNNKCPMFIECNFSQEQADVCNKLFLENKDGRLSVLQELPELFKNYKPVTNQDKEFFFTFKEITCRKICYRIVIDDFIDRCFDYFKQGMMEKYSKQKTYNKNKYRREINKLDIEDL